MLILEVGINHFGSLLEAKKYLNFFLKSDFEYSWLAAEER